MMQHAVAVTIIFSTMESKTSQQNKTKAKHLLAKQSQDFEVI